MAISRADFSSFISELVTRNPNLGIPALENGLFANLLISDYLYYIYTRVTRAQDHTVLGEACGLPCILCPGRCVSDAFELRLGATPSSLGETHGGVVCDQRVN